MDHSWKPISKKLRKLQKGRKNEFSCHSCDKEFTDGPFLKTYIKNDHGKKKPKSFESSKKGEKTNFHVTVLIKNLQMDHSWKPISK